MCVLTSVRLRGKIRVVEGVVRLWEVARFSKLRNAVF